MMQPWRICLLGTPYANQGELRIHLQAKESWALLASLLLPLTLADDKFPNTTLVHSSETLADRFWEDGKDPRSSLRQSVAFLRKTFDKNNPNSVIVSGRDTVEARRLCFVTDIEEMLISYQRALVSDSLKDRIAHLSDAQEKMRGDFLSGCILSSISGEKWVHNRRVQVADKMVRVLLALVAALTESGQLSAALDVACQALQFQPEHEEAKSRMWELAIETGQSYIAESVEAEGSFETVVESLQGKTEAQLTIKSRQRFRSLFLTNLETLPIDLREKFLQLAIFPTSFTAKLAHNVCGTPIKILKELAQTPLLDQQGSDYVIPEVVKAAAWDQISTATKRQLHKRLAIYCHSWLKTITAPSFDTFIRAEPFFRMTLEWYFTQPPTMELVTLIDCLLLLEASDLLKESIPRLRQICEKDNLSLLLRYRIVSVVGYILSRYGDFPGAITFLEEAITLEDALPEDYQTYKNNHLQIALAYHYSGDSRTALKYLHAAKGYFKHTRQEIRMASYLRVQSEIQNHLGEFSEALDACEQAVAIRRIAYPDHPTLADALFWKGSTLFRLGQFTDAMGCILEALSIWQEFGDSTGVGHCLRLLGRLRAEEGNIIEAKAHLLHAILLHESTGSVGSRIAAVEVLADIYLEENKFPKAKELYEECLAYNNTQQIDRSHQIERFQTKIALCEP